MSSSYSDILITASFTARWISSCCLSVNSCEFTTQSRASKSEKTSEMAPRFHTSSKRASYYFILYTETDRPHDIKFSRVLIPFFCSYILKSIPSYYPVIWMYVTTIRCLSTRSCCQGGVFLYHTWTRWGRYSQQTDRQTERKIMNKKPVYE